MLALVVEFKLHVFPDFIAPKRTLMIIIVQKTESESQEIERYVSRFPTQSISILHLHVLE